MIIISLNLKYLSIVKNFIFILCQLSHVFYPFEKMCMKPKSNNI